MVDLLCTLRMVNLAGVYRPPTPDGWMTRTDPGKGTQTQVDHMVISEANHKGRSRFCMDYTSLDTDHHLLSAYISCPRKLPKRKKARRVHRYLVEKLRERPIDKPAEKREPTPTAEYQKSSLRGVWRGLRPTTDRSGSTEPRDTDLYHSAEGLYWAHEQGP